jgi:hypothetical protein
MQTGLTGKRFLRKALQAPAHWRLRLALIAVLALQGCANPPPFHVVPEERARLTENGLVSVFGRFTIESEWEGKTWEGSILPRLASAELGRRVQLIVHRRYNAERRRMGYYYWSDPGWFRVLLKPGTYIMELSPPVDKAFRLFTFTVPEGAEVVYLGTHKFKCRGRERGAFSDYPLTCDDKVLVSDEKAAAAGQLQIALADLQSVPLRPYGDVPPPVHASARPRGPGEAEGAVPTRIELKKGWRPAVPNWSRFHATEQVDEIGVGGAMARMMGAEHMVRSGLIAPFALAGLARTREAVNRWTPCLVALDAKLRGADLEGIFRRRIRFHAKASQGAALGAGGNESILKADVQRVMLRKCTQAKSYCVEVAVRTRLWVDGKATYDQVHAYSRQGGGDRRLTHNRYRIGQGNNFFWEKPVESASPCRDIGDYCGAQGHARVLKEVETALDAIVAAVARDLSGKPARSDRRP